MFSAERTLHVSTHYYDTLLQAVLYRQLWRTKRCCRIAKQDRWADHHVWIIPYLGQFKEEERHQEEGEACGRYVI